MQDFLHVTGMVIGSYSHNEYDRRITLLTREVGRITAFVKGAKRQGSMFAASTDIGAFGEFDLYVGKNAYDVKGAQISNYFEFLRKDMDASFYSAYFMELADYYANEGDDETLLLLLLYRALQGLKSEKIKNDFVRVVFELKLFCIEGEFIPIDRIGNYSDACRNVCNFIAQADIADVFNFSVESAVCGEMMEIARYERLHLVDRKMKSLEILEMVSE